MTKHQIPLVSAELLGHHMGLLVPKKYKDLFWLDATGKRPRAGYGTQIGKKGKSPNDAFKKLDIPLSFNQHLIDKIDDENGLRKLLKSAETDDKDVMVCFDWGILFSNKSTCGHVCLFDRLLSSGKVRIIDTEYKAPKWRLVNLSRLFKAMKKHGPENGGGLWNIKYVGK
jgi:hypothetical protein